MVEVHAEEGSDILAHFISPATGVLCHSEKRRANLVFASQLSVDPKICTN